MVERPTNPTGWEPTEDWYLVVAERPPQGRIVELMRRDWLQPVFSDRADWPPELNIAGLYWRYP